jgi:hypothetical protein
LLHGAEELEISRHNFGITRLNFISITKCKVHQSAKGEGRSRRAHTGLVGYMYYYVLGGTCSGRNEIRHSFMLMSFIHGTGGGAKSTLFLPRALFGSLGWKRQNLDRGLKYLLTELYSLPVWSQAAVWCYNRPVEKWSR